MTFPTVRLSRLRSHEIFRRMVRQITLRVDDLVAPLFVYHGEKVKKRYRSHAGADILLTYHAPDAARWLG